MRMVNKRAGSRRLEFEVQPQPDDTTCGPTCLHAVYAYYGDSIGLDTVIAETRSLPEGGTLAVMLACHALRRGYRSDIYTYNLQIFDPTWFHEGKDLSACLRAQRRAKRDEKLDLATEAYLEFLGLGGRIHYVELTPALIRRFLSNGNPVLTGLSATYLYSCAREDEEDYDDVAGSPMGHFVVLSGYDRESRVIRVSDPLQDNPRFDSQYYDVGVNRIICAILLGIVTYDANLLVVRPGE